MDRQAGPERQSLGWIPPSGCLGSYAALIPKDGDLYRTSEALRVIGSTPLGMNVITAGPVEVERKYVFSLERVAGANETLVGTVLRAKPASSGSARGWRGAWIAEVRLDPLETRFVRLVAGIHAQDERSA